MQVDAVAVDLPDLDDGAADRSAPPVEDAPPQVGNFAEGGRGRIADDDQVVVDVEREGVRIERPLGLTRRQDQLLGEEAGRRPERGGPDRPDGYAAEEPPAGGELVVVLHGAGSSSVRYLGARR